MSDLNRMRALAGLSTLNESVGTDRPLEGEFLQALKNAARKNSEGGYVQHVNRDEHSKSGYVISDWYDSDSTIASYENGRPIGNTTEAIDSDIPEFDDSFEEKFYIVDQYLKKLRWLPADKRGDLAEKIIYAYEEDPKNGIQQVQKFLNEIGVTDWNHNYNIRQQIDALLKRGATESVNEDEAEMQTQATAADNSADAEADAAMNNQSDEVVENLEEGASREEKEYFWNIIKGFLEDSDISDYDIKRGRYWYFKGDYPSEFYGSNYQHASDTGTDIGFSADDAINITNKVIQDKVADMNSRTTDVTGKHNPNEWSLADQEDLRKSLDFNEDIQNGYNDRHYADEFGKYPNFAIPSGQDGPVTKKTGAAGARQGDNPEQKTMAVSEDIHKELVYKYRDYLKESGTFDLKKKLSEELDSSLKIALEDTHGNWSGDSESVTYSGPITVVGTALNKQGDVVTISYSINITAQGTVNWESEESPSGWNHDNDGIEYSQGQAASPGTLSVTSAVLTAADIFIIDDEEYSPSECKTILHRETIKHIKDPQTYVSVLSPEFERYVGELPTPTDECIW